MCIICFYFVSTFHIFKEKPAVKTSTSNFQLKGLGKKLVFFIISVVLLYIFIHFQKKPIEAFQMQKKVHTHIMLLMFVATGK